LRESYRSLGANDRRTVDAALGPSITVALAAGAP